MRLRAVTLIALAIAATLSTADAARRLKKQEDAAPAPTPGDKRDRLVTAPGTPFNGRAFWQAAAQCGGIYFRLNTLYSDAAISAKVIKPDPAAFTRLSRDADGASVNATAFFDVSERFLVADRKVSREDAVVTYDNVAHTAGDRFKSVEAALQGAKPCPEFYRVCRGAFPQVCNDATALTN
jgi:hypothetical protein